MDSHAASINLLEFSLQEWNDELAQVAQTHAEQCVFEQNANRASQVATFSSVGENVLANTATVVDYAGLVQIWFDERGDYVFSTEICNNICGHYTQVKS